MNLNCTAIPETCPLPQVCYVVTTKNSSNYCACLSNQDFTGPNCDEMTGGTIASIFFLAIALMIIVFYFTYSTVKIGKLIVLELSIKRSKRINETLVASLFALLNLLFLIIYLIFLAFETAHPTYISYTGTGIRVSYLYTERGVVITLGTSCSVCGLLILSTTFYEVAYHTRKMREMSDLLYIRRTAFTVTFLLAISALILIALQMQSYVYILLASVGIFLFILLYCRRFRRSI